MRVNEALAFFQTHRRGKPLVPAIGYITSDVHTPSRTKGESKDEIPLLQVIARLLTICDQNKSYSILTDGRPDVLILSIAGAVPQFDADIGLACPAPHLSVEFEYSTAHRRFAGSHGGMVRVRYSISNVVRDCSFPLFEGPTTTTLTSTDISREREINNALKYNATSKKPQQKLRQGKPQPWSTDIQKYMVNHAVKR